MALEFVVAIPTSISQGSLELRQASQRRSERFRLFTFESRMPNGTRIVTIKVFNPSYDSSK
jgi:uncharacterized protein with von Willebrand factor type A (vWA) domain